MKGIFLQGDFLYIHDIDLKNFSKGDVVAFRNSIKDNLVVHRVVKISKNNLTTKGDNNPFVDPLPVERSNLVGKVDKFERRGKEYKVKGGLSGLYIAEVKFSFRRFIFWLYKKITSLSPIRFLGRLLLNSNLEKIMKIKINSADGIVIKWVLKGKMIAQKGPEKNYFYIKKPFDLIIKK